MRRRTQTLLIFLLLLPLALIGLILATLQIPAVRATLLAQLGEFTAGQPVQVRIEGWKGRVPDTLRLEHIRLADSKGPWLEIDGLSLDWSPLALITGKLRVADSSAKRIVLLRLPELPPSPDQEPEEESGPFQWPPQLPTLELQHIAVETIDIAPEVAGEALRLSLAGEARSDPGSGTAYLHLNLISKDSTNPLLTLSIEGEKKLNQLSIDLKIDDANGLLSHLANTSEPQPLTVNLNGSGALNDWQGQLDIRAKALASLESSIALDLLERGRIELDGKVLASGEALPAGLAPLLSEGLTFKTQVDGVTREKINIHQLQLKAAELATNLQGTITPQTQQIDLQFAANATDLNTFSSLAGITFAGSANIKATAQGTFEQPKVQLSINGQGLQAADAHIAGLQADLQTIPENTQTLKITGSGSVRKIIYPAFSAPVDDAAWQLSALLERFEQITLQRFDLASLGARLNAQGDFNITNQQGHLESRLDAADLTTLTSLLGADAAGQAQLNVKLDVADQLREIKGGVTASGSKLSGLPTTVTGLIGESPRFEAHFQLEPDKRLQVDALKIEGANLGVDGTLSAGLPNGVLEGNLNLNVMDLALLSSALDQSIAGALQSELTLAGKVKTPQVHLNAVANNLVVDNRKLGEIKLDARLTGAGEQRYEGITHLHAKAPEGELKATADYIAEPTRVAVNNLRITGPGLQATGQFASDLPVTLPSGNLQGEVLDLASLSPWLGQGYGGHINFALDAPADNPQQQVTVTTEADGVKTPFGQLKQLQAKINAIHLRATPHFQANVKLLEFDNSTNLKITQLDINAEGPIDGLQINTKLGGHHEDKPFQLDTRSKIAIETDAFGAELAQLEARYDEIPINLTNALKLRTTSEGQITLQPFELRIADGHFKAEGELSSSSNQAVLDGKLPLTILKTLGGPDLEGNASINAKLTGTPIQPRIEANLQLTNLKPAAVEQNISAIGLRADARFENGTANVEVRTQGLAERPGKARLQLPLQLALNPFSFEIPEKGLIQGNIDLALALDRLTQVLALRDPVLAGILDARFDITGTLTDPALAGNASLNQGRVVSEVTGTHLEDLKLDLNVQERQISLRELSAKDGDSGQLNLAGDVDLSALDNPVFNMHLDLKHAHLVRLAEADVTLSGLIEAKGELKEMNVKGNILVDETEIKIPGNPGPSIPELEVTEVNVPGEEEKGAEDEESKSGNKIGLDIAINMPARIFVRGRGLDSEWEGKLKVQGTAAKPAIVGDINVRRGRFDFLERRFKLREGTIQFSGAMPPEPYIDLEAATELADMTAIVRARGLAARPELELSAEPERPQDEILARILFNRDLSSITPFQAAKLASAVNQLRGGGGFDPTASLRDATGLDTLDVGVDESGNVSLTAGKYINDKTFLQFKPSIGTASGKLRVERELSRKFSTDAELEDDGGTSVGLGWKYDY